MKFSVVIPARNEEKYIGACFRSIRVAAGRYGCDPELIVVLNRCTDRTEEIARAAGAKIVQQDGKNLSRIRNAGARAATGDVLITIDADSVMHENLFIEAAKAVESGKYIGGGVHILTERMSAGIFLSVLFLFLFLVPSGISAGLFWCRREDFMAVGGFDEEKHVAEDIDFAVRLRKFGRERGMKYGTLWKAPIYTSCRKFDKFGDWFLIRFMLMHPRMMLGSFAGITQEQSNQLFYDFQRGPAANECARTDDSDRAVPESGDET